MPAPAPQVRESVKAVNFPPGIRKPLFALQAVYQTPPQMHRSAPEVDTHCFLSSCIRYGSILLGYIL